MRQKLILVIKNGNKILVEHDNDDYRLPIIKINNSSYSVSDMENKIKEKYDLEVIGLKEAFTYDGIIGYEAHIPHKMTSTIDYSKKWLTIKMALKHGFSNVDNLKLEEYFNSLDSVGIQLQYGKRGGKIVHISELTETDKGLACFCQCPACNGDLEARLGSKRRHHFAHHKEACNIVAAQQTALHLLAKEILMESQHIMLPAFILEGHEGGFVDESLSNYEAINQQLKSYEYRKSIDYKFDHAILEKSIGDIVPDVVIWRDSNGRKLIVEVAVTHFINESKRDKIIEKGISALEIDISQLHNKKFDRKVLKDIIIEGIKSKKWIYNIQYDQALLRLAERNDNIATKAKKEESERQARLEKIMQEKQDRALMKEKKDQIKMEQVRKELQEGNYRALAVSLRNDELANKHFRKTKLYSILGPEIPFYLDIPVTGQIVFTCDRRIWQMVIFEKLLYYKKKGWSISLNNIWTDFAEKTSKKLLNWDLIVKQNLVIGNKTYTDNLAIDAIKQYFCYLGRLGFIECEGYIYFKKKYAIMPQINIDTPIAKRLESIFDNIKDYSPEVDSDVAEIYNYLLPENNHHKEVKFYD